MENKRRLIELDALRGLASLSVVLFHYTTRYEELFGHIKEPYLNFPYGQFGVQFFFMVSGFLIFITLNRVKDFKSYLRKRIVRLYPAYIIAVVLIYIIVKMYGLEGRTVSLWEALFNLTMLQGHFPFVSHVDGAFWTLTVQLTFYIFMGIMFYKGLAKNIVSFSIAWLSISSLIMIISNQLNSVLLSLVRVWSISQYSHLFIAGMMFYHLRENGKKSNYIVILACLAFEYIFVKNYVTNIFVTIFFLLFYLLITNKLRFLATKPLVFLGSISYHVYLLHQNLGYIIINILEKNGYVNEIYLLIPISIIIILATIFIFYIERPLNIRLKKRQEAVPVLIQK